MVLSGMAVRVRSVVHICGRVAARGSSSGRTIVGCRLLTGCVVTTSLCARMAGIEVVCKRKRQSGRPPSPPVAPQRSPSVRVAQQLCESWGEAALRRHGRHHQPRPFLRHRLGVLRLLLSLSTRRNCVWGLQLRSDGLSGFVTVTSTMISPEGMRVELGFVRHLASQSRNYRRRGSRHFVPCRRVFQSST